MVTQEQYNKAAVEIIKKTDCDIDTMIRMCDFAGRLEAALFGEVNEIPNFAGTLKTLDDLTIIGGCR